MSPGLWGAVGGVVAGTGHAVESVFTGAGGIVGGVVGGVAGGVSALFGGPGYAYYGNSFAACRFNAAGIVVAARHCLWWSTALMGELLARLRPAQRRRPRRRTEQDCRKPGSEQVCVGPPMRTLLDGPTPPGPTTQPPRAPGVLPRFSLWPLGRAIRKASIQAGAWSLAFSQPRTSRSTPAPFRRALRQCAQQQMVDAQTGVAGIGVPEIVPNV